MVTLLGRRTGSPPLRGAGELLPPRDRLKVLDCSQAAEVEGVLACGAVARTGTLSIGEMGEPMLDGDALTQLGSSCVGGLEMAQLLLERLVVAHGDAAPSTRGCTGALRT